MSLFIRDLSTKSLNNSLYLNYKITIQSMSILGPMGKNGEECQNHCPLKCGDDEMNCYGGKDWNSCQYPDFCHPLKDGKK